MCTPTRLSMRYRNSSPRPAASSVQSAYGTSDSRVSAALAGAEAAALFCTLLLPLAGAETRVGHAHEDDDDAGHDEHPDDGAALALRPCAALHLQVGELRNGLQAVALARGAVPDGERHVGRLPRLEGRVVSPRLPFPRGQDV